MFVLVKFKLDGITEIVPLHFIKNWKQWKIDRPSDIQVFWSPNEETPSEVYLAQGKILDVEDIKETSKGKNLKPLAGYYRATVVKSADSREELEILLESKAIRSTLKRKANMEITNHKPKVVNLSSSSHPESQKVSQNLPPARLKTLSNKSNIEKLVKMPTLFENKLKENLSDDSPSDSSCSDDGVIPEKLYKKEVSNWKEQYQTLKEKYKSLKLKYEKVCSLNIKLQERLLERPQKIQSFTEKRSIENNKKMSNLSGPGPSTQPSESKPESSKLLSLPVKVYQKPIQSDPTTKPKSPDVTNQVLSTNSSYDNNDNELFEITQTKVKLMKRVKVGEAGDSLFVKNVALILWTPKELTSSSVTGQRCHAKKDSVAKPPLCTEKWKVLCDTFKKRLEEEGCSADDLKRRLSKVRAYVAEKIVTLNRIPQTQSYTSTVITENIGSLNAGLNPDGTRDKEDEEE